MPTYEYACHWCRLRFEATRFVATRHDAPCPQCSRDAHKAPSAPAFHLKGPGFHATDYRKKP